MVSFLVIPLLFLHRSFDSPTYPFNWQAAGRDVLRLSESKERGCHAIEG